MTTFFASGAVILTLMVLLWLLSLALHNSSIVDIFWGAGFVITAWIYFLLTPQNDLTARLVVCILASIWGLRLSLHVYRRNHGKPEDFRYAAWRKEHGGKWRWRSLFQVFLLQGFLLWIISVPLLAAQLAVPPLPAWMLIPGVLVWLAGIFFEAVGDWQLSLFKADPANHGKLMTSGLWRYTRHPNYFGDSAVWWGLYLLALAAGGWWAVFSPILMTYLLINVSGVAMLEKSMSRRPGFKEYADTTPAFVPWFPRKKNRA